MLKAIIFDMDGVICDSEPLHMHAFQHVLEEEGIALTDQDYYDRYLAFDDRGCFETIFKANHRSLDPQQLKNLLARKARYFDVAMKERLMIFPGADSFVKKAAKKHRLALASGARRLEVEFVLKKAKLKNYFTAVVSADDVQQGKPHPESFLTALAVLNERRLQGTEEVKPEECLVIEDSRHGLTAAKSAGMKSVALTTSYPAAELAASDLVVDSLMGLELDRLEKLFVNNGL
jgi:beta-phosphoglucomutase